MPSADSETHVVAEITQEIPNPTTAIPLINLGHKHTAVLKQITYIFNLDIPTKETPPYTKETPTE